MRADVEERAHLPELLRLGLRHAGDRAVLVVDRAGRVLAGAGFGPRFGSGGETDLAGGSLESFYAAADRAAGLPARHLEEAATQGSCLAEAVGQGVDLRPFPMDVRVERMALDGVDTFGCILTDATERRRGADALRALAEERRARDQVGRTADQLREMIDGMPSAMLVVDRDWRITFLNQRGRDLLRLPADERRADLRRLLSRSGGGLLGRIEHVLSERVALEFEEHYPLSGAWFEVQVTPIPSGVCVLFRDISESRHHEEQLRSLALFEPATALPNRTLFIDRADQAVANARRTKQLLSIIVVDVGLASGRGPRGSDALEAAVRGAARQMAALVRRNDTLGQISPARFALVQNALGRLDGAAIWAGKLIDAVSQPDEATGVRRTAHAGIAVLGTDGATAEALLAAAEHAVVQAATSARRYRFANPALDREIAERTRLEGELRDAIVLDQFRVNYQPVVDVVTGHLTALEALLRWVHPTGQVVPADQFLAVADEMGLSDVLADRALSEIAAQAAAWRAAGLTLPPISINVARAQVTGGDFVTRLLAALGEHRLPSATLQVELPEALLAAEAVAADRFVRDLHGAGVLTVIDDFGSGHLPFAAACALPLAGVKLASAVLTGGEPARAIRAVCQLAGQLGWSVVLKGVEEPAQLDQLAGIGGIGAQGYHLGPPAAAGDITALLRSAAAAPPAATN